MNSAPEWYASLWQEDAAWFAEQAMLALGCGDLLRAAHAQRLAHEFADKARGMLFQVLGVPAHAIFATEADSHS